MSVLAKIGLFLDIVGAVLIAVPDASFLSNRFKNGLLAEARERMVIYDGVCKGDPGFQELVTLIEELEPVAGFGTENEDCGDEYVAIVADRLGGTFSSPEAYEHESFKWSDPYIQARYEEDMADQDYDRADYYDVDEVYNLLRGRIEPETTNLRFFGLLTLTTGFLFQFMSALKSPIWLSVLVAIAVWLVALYLLRY